MNPRRLESRALRAQIIFDTEDGHARSERVLGAHPRPVGAICYRIVARTVDGALVGLADPLTLRVVRNPSGFDLWYGHHRTRDQGHRKLALAAGDYVLRVDGDYYQPAEQPLTIPAAGVVKVDLWPGVRYPFPGAAPPGRRRLVLLRGVVLKDADGSAVPDAEVSVAGWPRTCVTDRGGQWVLPGPPGAQAADVTARAPDGVAKTQPGVAVRGDRESTTVPEFRF